MNIKKSVQLAIGISLIIMGLIYFTIKNPMNIGNKLPFETEVYAEKARVETLKPDDDGCIRIYYDNNSCFPSGPEGEVNTFKEYKLIDDIITSDDGATYVFTPEHFNQYKELKTIDANSLKTIEQDENGFIRLFYKTELLGGPTPQQMRDANKFYDLVNDVIADKKGVTYVINIENFKEYKDYLADGCRLTNYIDVTSLRKEPKYTDKLKQNAILYVDRQQFFSTKADQFTLLLGVIMYSANYQILSGVSTYEWTTAVTVVDYQTNEVLASYIYPNENREVYIKVIHDPKE